MLMTAEQIERRVEHLFDVLDRGLMQGRMTQEEYEHDAKVITEWADREYLTVKE